MMSTKDNERLKKTLSMCHLGRTRSKKYDGRGGWDDEKLMFIFSRIKKDEGQARDGDVTLKL